MRGSEKLTCARVDYRQLVFDNIVQGMKLIIDAMDEWEMTVDPSNRVNSFPLKHPSFSLITLLLCSPPGNLVAIHHPRRQRTRY
jgi:hypothetical protein